MLRRVRLIPTFEHVQVPTYVVDGIGFFDVDDNGSIAQVYYMHQGGRRRDPCLRVVLPGPWSSVVARDRILANYLPVVSAKPQ